VNIIPDLVEGGPGYSSGDSVLNIDVAVIWLGNIFS